MYDMRLDSTNKGPDYFLTAYVTDYIVAKYMNYSETERDHLPLYIRFGLNPRLQLLFLSHLSINTLKARYNRISSVMDRFLHYVVLSTYLLQILKLQVVNPPFAMY